MNPPYLPQELLDVVIESLQGDTPMLCFCSLVTRSRTNPAHRILFHHFQHVRQYATKREVAQYHKLLEFFKFTPQYASISKC